MMKTLAYYNGKISELDDMMIPLNDRGNFFGDGIYEATMCNNQNIFLLDDHLTRLYNSADLIEIEVPLQKDELAKLLHELLAKVEDGPHLMYWQVTRGTARRLHYYPDGPANLTVTILPGNLEDLTDKEAVQTEEDIRYLMCNVKTLNLLPNVMSLERAKKKGLYETIYHRGERVTECAHSNVSILKDGVFKTAPTDNMILPGIARAHLIKQCNLLGVPVLEEPFTVAEMMDADEVIISNSIALCKGTKEIDGIAVGGRDEALLEKIKTAVLDEYHAEVSR
ncbi:MAG: aminotransferase class IV [Lactobacillaceae bacterium]|jgi:D-alanine transaminase|nr:aminotransferase class IV [Lactobacillaceae bacterium]